MSTYRDNKKLKVVQLFGGPGIGKSVTAAELFVLMKKKGHSVELIHEVAKDMVWEGRTRMFYEQEWIFANQHQLQRRLVDHNVEYAVMDTSILLGLFYMDEQYPPALKDLIEQVYHSYTNINVVLERNPNFVYEQLGRNQDENEAKVLDERISQYFDNERIPYQRILAGDTAAAEIYRSLAKA